MLEYVFFDAGLCDRFIALLEGHQVEWQRRHANEAISLFVDDEIDDDLLDRLEDAYDGLMDEQRRLTLAEDQAHADRVHLVGVQFSRRDGSVAQARLDPELVARLLREISIEELQELVQAVADEAGGEGLRPLCES